MKAPLFLALVSLTTAAHSQDAAPLFNGKDLSGWVPVNVARDTFTVSDGMVVISGNPTGYMRTAKMYENFILECDWQHMKVGGNSGVFVWGDGIPAMGTGYTRGIEVQVLDNGYNAKGKNEHYTTHGDIFPIWGATMTPFGRVAGSRSFPTQELSKSSPEWNHYKVTGRGGELRLEVNGTEVTVGKDCVPRKGYLALESEGAECHFKNLRLQELPTSNPAPEQVAEPYEGFVSLFNGVNFEGWKVPEGDNGHWKASGGVIDYDAKSEAPGEKHLWTQKEYGNYTLIIDWRLKEAPYQNPRAVAINPDGSEPVGPDGKPATITVADADSGILLGGNQKFQVNIWCWPIGSGEMYGIRRDPATPPAIRAAVTPKMKADNAVGKWNRYQITVNKGTVRTILNGKEVIPETVVPGLPARGPIGLQHHGAQKDGVWVSPPALVQYRNVFLKELPE